MFIRDNNSSSENYTKWILKYEKESIILADATGIF